MFNTSTSGYAISLNENVARNPDETGNIPASAVIIRFQTDMTDKAEPADAMEFLRKMWSNMGIPVPGMVVPTLDVGELEKRITDLKAVEGWLKMNLNLLQMHIQGLEMQCSTLSAMKQFGQTAEAASAQNPFTNPALWPWNVMQQAASAASGDEKTQGKPDKG